MKKRKTHFAKEIAIMLTLLILIILMIAVALYDYIPSNMGIPQTIEYASDSKTTAIKQEIAYTNGGDVTADQSLNDKEMLTSLKSYSIEASDLTIYEQKNLYNSGNSNPFEYSEEANPQQQTPEATNPNTTNPAPEQTNQPQTNDSKPAQTSAETKTETKSETTPGTFFENSASK